ncbi:MAG: alpha-galactosidase, partial [Pseudomonadota bacterium]
LLLPGEIRLAPGDSYHSPVLYAAVSQAGFSGLSQRFHSHIRNTVMDGRIKRKPRPIHYNTWEAVYFDHDLQTLKSLADKAAQVGVERFILDDGWFGSRRNDQSGLGDWVVSPDVYPDGLAPLIDHVQDLDMEFGLWFEPEMVNPDSDLFRAHPDWVLQVDGVEHIPFRNQYVLDLTRDEVSNYLFERLDALLSEYAIAYVKWDMNRDIHHPGSNGRPAAHAQTRAVYALMDRLRAAHPNVEIESCASGGGRADYGVLQRTDRIWTSDSNDALDRQRIQSGATHFFPLEILGAHVGPRTCHITGRKLSMSLRVATAFFGHMGLELNLLKESERDLGTLAAGIALHKVYRDVLHAGDFFRLDTPDHVNAVSVVAQDQCQALLSWCQLTGHRETEPGRVYFVGLDPKRRYITRIIWPSPVRSQTAPSILETADLTGDGTIFSGAALMQIGLQLPLLLPETCLIFDLTAVDHSD